MSIKIGCYMSDLCPLSFKREESCQGRLLHLIWNWSVYITPLNSTQCNLSVIFLMYFPVLPKIKS